MIVSFPQGKARIVGDPHLGKKFHNCVPVSKLGYRETMVFKDFKSKFTDLKDIAFHICLGDLFDSQEISWSLLMKVVDTYTTASKTYPDTVFYILRGNHDAGKREEVSVFDVFHELLSNYKNVKVIRDLYYAPELKGLFVPWRYSKYTETQIEEYLKSGSKKVEYVFMHDDPENLFLDLWPKYSIEALYNGHIHYPSCFSHRGYSVYFVGSMQPYAHSEDNTGSLYMTVQETDLVEDPAKYRGKILRVVKTSEDPLPELDVLGLSVVYNEEDKKSVNSENLENFNIYETLDKLMDKYNVPEYLRDWIKQGCFMD